MVLLAARHLLTIRRSAIAASAHVATMRIATKPVRATPAKTQRGSVPSRGESSRVAPAGAKLGQSRPISANLGEGDACALPLLAHRLALDQQHLRVRTASLHTSSCEQAVWSRGGGCECGRRLFTPTSVYTSCAPSSPLPLRLVRPDCSRVSRYLGAISHHQPNHQKAKHDHPDLDADSAGSARQRVPPVKGDAPPDGDLVRVAAYSQLSAGLRLSTAGRRPGARGRRRGGRPTRAASPRACGEAGQSRPRSSGLRCGSGEMREADESSLTVSGECGRSRLRWRRCSKLQMRGESRTVSAASLAARVVSVHWPLRRRRR